MRDSHGHERTLLTTNPRNEKPRPGEIVGCSICNELAGGRISNGGPVHDGDALDRIPGIVIHILDEAHTQPGIVVRYYGESSVIRPANCFEVGIRNPRG